MTPGKWTINYFVGYYDPNHDISGMPGWWYCNMMIHRSPTAPALLTDEVVQGKVHFIEKANFSDIDFASIQLLQHSNREYLACLNGSNTKCLESIYLAWIQENAVINDTVSWHASSPSLSRSTANGSSWTFQYQLLNDFNICIYNCRTRRPTFPEWSSLTSPLSWNFWNRAFIVSLFDSSVTYFLSKNKCFNNILIHAEKF